MIPLIFIFESYALARNNIITLDRNLSSALEELYNPLLLRIIITVLLDNILRLYVPILSVPDSADRRWSIIIDNIITVNSGPTFSETAESKVNLLYYSSAGRSTTTTTFRIIPSSTILSGRLLLSPSFTSPPFSSPSAFTGLVLYSISLSLYLILFLICSLYAL